MSEPTGDERLVLCGDFASVQVSDLPSSQSSELAEVADGVFVYRQTVPGTQMVISSDMAALLEHFRKPRSLLDAAGAFGKPRRMAAIDVLERAAAELERLMRSRILVIENARSAAFFESLARGERLSGGSVLRELSHANGAQVYLLREVSRDSPEGIQRSEWIAKRADLNNPLARHLMDVEKDVLTRLGDGNLWVNVDPTREPQSDLLHLELVRGVAVDHEEPWQSSRLERLRLCLEVARCYAVLHDRGVLHIDVHPKNVLADHTGSCRLIDFGFARVAQPDGSFERMPVGAGVLPFCPPEHAIAQLEERDFWQPSFEAEQYSVAALLYVIFARHYYADFSMRSSLLLCEIRDVEPLPLPPGWGDLEVVLHRGLAKDPRDRFGSLDELARALEVVLERAWSEKAPGARTPSKRSAGVMTGQNARHPLVLLCEPDARENGSLARASRKLLETARSSLDAEDDASRWLALWTTPWLGIVGGDSQGLSETVDAALSLESEDSERGAFEGLAAQLLLVAELLDFDARVFDVDLPVERLLETGADLLRDCESRLVERPVLPHLGLDSGLAGELIAVLSYCRVADQLPSAMTIVRLAELAGRAESLGRGSIWPSAEQSSEDAALSSLGQGAAGLLFLFWLAADVTGDRRFEELAESAAWTVWDCQDSQLDLYGGMTGRLLALVHHASRAVEREPWLERGLRIVGELERRTDDLDLLDRRVVSWCRALLSPRESDG